MLEQLTHIGFKKAGAWSLVDGKPALQLFAEENSKNILYSFVVDNIPMYIGKTVQPLRKRMYGYINPVDTQSTNQRNSKLILEALSRGAIIEVFVLPDHGLLHFGPFHLNLAAGLEDSILKRVNPAWNCVGSRPKK